MSISIAMNDRPTSYNDRKFVGGSTDSILWIAMAVTKLDFVYILVYSCLLFLLSPSSAAETIVEVTTPVNPVTLGGILAIRCKIWNMEKGHVVKLFRTSSSHTEEITSGDTYMGSSINQRVFLAIKRNLSDGSIVYFITIIKTTNADQGEYACKIFGISDFNYVNVAGDSIQVNVVSLPGVSYPVCTSVPKEPLRMIENSTLKLQCYSELAVPSVTLKWRRGYAHNYINALNLTDGTLLYSMANVTVDESLDGSTFYCDVTSKEFPDWIRTCQIGPVSVKPSQKGNSITATTQRSQFKVNMVQRASTNCECQLNTRRKFNLTLATAAFSILSIIFLMITVFMCYKYRKVSGIDGMDRHIDDDLEINYDENSEPVYVTLQRCSTGETSYLALDDPNNPDNKVLLPKDVFEAYYNTLSLKRERRS